VKIRVSKTETIGDVASDWLTIPVNAAESDSRCMGSFGGMGIGGRIPGIIKNYFR
jgi:hypothetical protein